METNDTSNDELLAKMLAESDCADFPIEYNKEVPRPANFKDQLCGDLTAKIITAPADKTPGDDLAEERMKSLTEYIYSDGLNLANITMPQTLDDFLVPREITELEYNFACRIEEVNIQRFWELVCYNTQVRMERPNVYRFGIKTRDLAIEFDLKDNETAPITIHADEESIIFTAPGQQELLEYILECKNNNRARYSFWHVILDRCGLEGNYNTKRSVHTTVIILDHKESKIYFLDSNGLSSVLSNKAEYTPHIDKLLDKYFGQLNEFGFNYQYIPCAKWNPGISLQVGSGCKNKKPFDNGNCLAIGILFTHWLSNFQDFNPENLYEHLGIMSKDERLALIYSYTVNIFRWMLKKGFIGKLYLLSLAKNISTNHI